MTISKVAIIGNPNCGKTTLFNKLTGSRQKVGNWSGVTVDKKTGTVDLDSEKIELVDLPGTYSLSVASEHNAIDELIACRYILGHEADLYINIIDAANLQRNLYLTLQLIEMRVPMIIALNMTDIAKKRNIHIDVEALQKLLQCPVVTLVSNRGKGLKNLKQAIQHYQPQPNPEFYFDPNLESHIQELQTLLPDGRYDKRWLAIRLFEKDAFAKQLIDEEVVKKTEQKVTALESLMGEEADILFADERYQLIQQVQQQVVKQNKRQTTLTAIIDSVVMHRIWGIPIFLFVMYLMFELSMNLGTLLQPLFDISSTTIFVGGVDYLGQQLGAPLWLTAIFSHGIGLGINTVVTFIPQIGLMFLFLSFLEDSGYMARAAFVMDRFMRAVGLPGKAFIPLIVGFGCNVPSIMATRTLDNRRDRILTAMMSPFMSCGARLAIFVVFATAFFPHHGGAVVFLLYITGILVAMLTGLLLKLSVLKGQDSPFLMELPVYHMPHGRTIFIMTWQRLKRFIFRAGKVIIPVCILVGSLNAIQLDGHINPDGSKQSILSKAGRVITPVLHPMGVEQNNWPATVGLITGTLAKEVVVGTLNTLYTQNETDAKQSYSLWGGLKDAVMSTVTGLKQVFSSSMINPFTANEAEHDMSRSAMGNMASSFGSSVAALAYLLFVLLYVPCISTMGVIAREIGKGWAYLSTFWSISIAYTAAVIFYQTFSFDKHVLSSALWIVGLLLFQLATFATLRRYADKPLKTGVN